MGSVIKRGKVWYIKYELPRGVDGKRQPKMQACSGMTKKEAEIALAEIERSIRRGEHTTTKHSVASYLKEWLDYSRPALAISTAALYGQLINAHLIPGLGSVKLSGLSPLHIQKFYKRLQQEGNERPALSAKSVKNIHGLLHRALEQAVRWSLILHNPCDRVEPPKAVKPTVKAAGVDELQHLIAAVEDTGEWRIPILLALYTGMRRGEVLALRWQDYDPKAQTLAVCRALSQYTGQVSVKSTKTERARVILIPDMLAETLNAHAKETEYHAPTDYICHRKDGRPLAPKRFSETFTQIAHKLELPITLHGLRHSHATMLIAAGVPVKVVSERLGHSDVNITQNIYAHVLPQMQQQAVNVLNGLQNGVAKKENEARG